MNNEFPEVGGIVGMFRDAILSISRSDQRDMALGAALAIAGTLTANRFKCKGLNVYTTMYVLNVASTSAGKGAAIDFTNDLFGFKGLGAYPSFRLLGLRNYSSDVSIIDRLDTQRTRLDVIDEFGQIYKGLAVKGDRKAAVCECLKSLFSAKAYFAGHHTKTNGTIGECLTPSIGILGTIQPMTLAENVTPEVLFDGFMGRFMYFMENINAEYLGNQMGGGLLQSALDYIVKNCLEVYPEVKLTDKNIDGSEIPPAKREYERTELKQSKAAYDFLHEIDREHYLMIQKMKQSGGNTQAAAIGRSIELTNKIAWILCVSGGTREMSLEHALMAQKIVEASNSKASEMLISAGSKTVFKDAAKILKFVKKNPLEQVRRNDAMKFCNLEPKQMKDAVELLIGRGELEEIFPNGPAANGRRTSYLCIPKTTS